ncbi:MRC [Mytilus coruscus]|uniref:MRC n=1 Tax=Mytilus coruscus TaxID=42192 RepID=A0A6J8EPD9_MYTCO|nr:MRC [Mytilus coruscus]
MPGIVAPSKDRNTFIVGSMHLHIDLDEFSLMYAESTDDFGTNKGALASCIYHNRDRNIACVGAKASCPDGFIANGQSCYMELNIPSTWAEASFYCTLFESHLLTIDSAGEQNIVSSMLSRFPAHFWIGLTDMFQPGTWIWSTTRTAPVYSHWAVGQPKDFNGQQNCAAMDRNHMFNWTASSCETKADFVCEALKQDGGSIIG